MYGKLSIITNIVQSQDIWPYHICKFGSFHSQSKVQNWFCRVFFALKILSGKI